MTGTRRIEDLRENPHNPRVELEPGDPEYEKIRESIEAYGLVTPLVWNSRSGHVISGHQRVRVLADLGWEEIPVFEVDLDEDDELALTVAMNRIVGRWDTPKLAGLLEELEEEGFDPRLTGMDQTEIDELLAALDAERSGRFLDSYLDEDGEEVETEDREPDHSTGDGWIKVSYVVSEKDRKIVIDALSRAKGEFGTATAASALARLCQQEIDRAEMAEAEEVELVQ